MCEDDSQLTPCLFGTPDKSPWFWVGHASGMNIEYGSFEGFVVHSSVERRTGWTVSPGASCTAYWQGSHLLTNTDTNKSNESRLFRSTSTICSATVEDVEVTYLTVCVLSGSQGSQLDKANGTKYSLWKMVWGMSRVEDNPCPTSLVSSVGYNHGQ